MFLKWYVYPSQPFLPSALTNLPVPPNEIYSQYFGYVSQDFVATPQQDIDGYISQFLGYQVQFEQAFNGSVKHNLEIHGWCSLPTSANYSFSNVMLREYAGSGGTIVLFQD